MSVYSTCKGYYIYLKEELTKDQIFSVLDKAHNKSPLSFNYTDSAAWAESMPFQKSDYSEIYFFTN